MKRGEMWPAVQRVQVGDGTKRDPRHGLFGNGLAANHDAFGVFHAVALVLNRAAHNSAVSQFNASLVATFPAPWAAAVPARGPWGAGLCLASARQAA